MSETTFTLEEAKSGRAKCKTCKEPIQKGEVRICVTIPANPDKDDSYDMSSYHHVGCFKLPRKMQHMGVEDFLDEVVTAEEGHGILPERRDEMLAKLEAAQDKGAANKRKNNDEEDTTLMGLVRKAAEGEPVKKKTKKGSKAVDQAEFDRMVELYKQYNKTKGEKLKDILRWNKQILAGKKDFVLFKVIDGEIHGRLGNCPLDQGQLKFDEGDYETVRCRGRFDEATQMRLPCSFETKRTDPNIRLKPFFTHEPSEEEKEELQRQTELARGGVNKASPEAEALLKSAEECDWDLSSKKGIKDATKELVELVEDKLDLPERDPLRLLGPIVLSLKDKGPKEIMQELIDKFGFKEAKEAKKEAAEKSMEKACANPKNAPLVMAFQELATLYFKEKNSNAGASYTKATQAIRDIKQEITAENAMSFSKGKTKVANIGKGSAEKMKEFMETGKIQKLEEKRADHA